MTDQNFSNHADPSSNGTTPIPFWHVGGFDNMTKTEKKNYDESRENFMYYIAFICFTMFAGVIFREWLRKRHFPYTALLFLFGCVLGILDHNFEQFRVLTDFAKFDTRLMMHLFLPAIIYESAFSLDPHMFFMALTQCLLLAAPGVILCSLLTGVFAKFILAAYHWDWIVCFIFGAILSATDPVAVVALLKEYGISPSLTTIIEGESLLNEGAAIVLFDSLLSVYEGGEFSLLGIAYHFTYNCGVSVAVSYLISLATIALLRRIELDTDIEVTFTFCIVYLTFYTSEISLGVSGVLSVVILGVSVSNYKSSINYEQDEETTMLQFWQTLSFWANTLIFTVVGILITSSNSLNFEGGDVGSIIATYVAASAFRALMIACFSPVLKNTGYGFTWTYGVVLTWGGLRGAVGLALVLIAQQSIPPPIAIQLLKQVSGVIFLTLVFNPPTMRILLKLLGIGQVTEKNVKGMSRAIALLRDAVNLTEKVTRMDKHLVGVDWMWVKQVTHIPNPYENVKDVSGGMYPTFDEDRGQCPECKADIKITPNEEEIKGLEEHSRLRILRAFEGSIWNQYNTFGVSRRTLRHLNTSVENAIDEQGKYVLTEEVSQKFMNISKFTQFMRKHMMKVSDKLKIEQRQSETELYLRNLNTEVKGFRKWCLSTYISQRFVVILYWILFLNLIPIAGEITSLLTRHGSTEEFEREIIIFEAINGILTLFYAFDAFVGIGGLGCKQYLSCDGNKIDFFITVIAVVQLLTGIVVIAAYQYTYSSTIIDILTVMSTIRLIRLIRVTLSGIFTNIMDEVCSVIYNAYDFAVGFVIANEKIAKTAATILDYEPSADLAQFTAENNIVQMLTLMRDLDTEYPDVTKAWKTQRATVYVLRDMKRVVKEMLDIYMLDENGAELLLEDLALKIKDTLCAPRYMPADTSMRSMMKNVLWIKNDDMLDMLLDNCAYGSFSTDDTIQESGTMHRNVGIITRGIIQVSGQNEGFKYKGLPNTDSLWYFIKNGSFCEYLSSPESIGLLGYMLHSECVTSATCSKDCELVQISFKTLKQAEEEFGDLSFLMWRPIALQIAQTILEEEEIYEYWTQERIRIHLEEGIFPDLQDTEDFEVHEAIADMVLIQGRVVDLDADVIYVGPTYIPSTVRYLTLMDNPKTRPRVVMILLREERYHSPTIMGWIDSSHITYKGLCLVHGIKKASLHHAERLNKAVGRHRPSFIQALRNIFSRKEERILQSDVP